MTKSEKDQPLEVEIRRAPKLLAFLLTGAAIGVAIAFVLYLFIPEDARSAANILGLLIVALGSLGLGLGITLSIFIDIRTAKRTKSALVNRVKK